MSGEAQETTEPELSLTTTGRVVSSKLYLYLIDTHSKLLMLYLCINYIIITTRAVLNMFLVY